MVRWHPDKQKNYQPSKYKRYTQDQYDTVMKQVRQHLKYSTIAENTGVKKSTIKNWASKTIKTLGTEKGLVFILDEELDIVSCLQHMADYWFPVNRDILKDLVQSYLRHTKKPNPFTNDRPENDWAHAFELRHHDIFRYKKEEPLSRARASGMHKENSLIDIFSTRSRNSSSNRNTAQR